jgi:pyrimidine-nucleoside phosphorylase
MVYLGKKAASIEDGIAKCKKTIADGSAYKKFLELVEAQGGNTEAIEQLGSYPLAKHSMEVKASASGYVNEIDSFELGMTSIALGAGREKIDDVIDMKAGILLKKKVGDTVDLGDTLAIFYTDREPVLSSARERIAKAYKISPNKPTAKPMILDVVDKNGVRGWK